MEIHPPHNIDLERSLLACCLMSDTAPTCQPDDFAVERHQLIAKAMQELELAGVKPDLVTVAGRFPAESGITSYLAEVYELAGSPDNLETYVEVVRAYASVRRAQVAALNFASQCNGYRWDANNSPLNAYCADIMALADTGRSDSVISATQAVKAFLSDLDRRMSNSCELTGLGTGVVDLDRLTCGLNPQELVVVAARPSMGKTALALQIAKFAAAKGDKVDIFSLEMPARSITQRMVSNQSRVPLSSIRKGRLDPSEYARVADASTAIATMPYRIIDNPQTEIEIVRKIRKSKPSLVIIDYLQLIMPSKKTGNPNQDIGGMATTMKNAAKELGIPIILLSQLTRKNDQDNREPRLSDLRDSGQIEQDADLVLFLHADKGDHQKPERKFILAKNRNGECGSWDMIFQLAFQRFERAYK